MCLKPGPVVVEITEVTGVGDRGGYGSRPNGGVPGSYGDGGSNIIKGGGGISRPSGEMDLRGFPQILEVVDTAELVEMDQLVETAAVMGIAVGRTRADVLRKQLADLS